jgi:hypothetical protein
MAAILSASAVAAAHVVHVATGSSIIHNYGGGAMGGCYQVDATGSVIYCAIPEDDLNPATAISNLTAFFQNSNATQPGQTCVSFKNALGGQCNIATASNNCPLRGVCQVVPSVHGVWNTFSGDYHFVEFTNITSGAELAGFDLTY